MMQTDIEATLSGVHVVVARPIAVGLPVIAQAAIDFRCNTLTFENLKIFSGKGRQQKQRLKEFQEVLLPKVFAPSAKVFEMVSLNILSQILYVIKQLTYIDLEMASTEIGRQIKHVNLDRLARQDLMQVDREVGVCPLPLYSFSETDWQIFQSRSADEIAEHLKVLQIYQYFFPAPDQAILGLVDRIQLPKERIDQDLQRLAGMGHPIGETELVGPASSMVRIIDELQGKGLMVEGNLHYNITESGKIIRGNVKFKPREGAISKLINRLQLTMNIRNYFR